MGLGGVFTDFAGWTSCHGLPHIGDAKNWPIRIFWTLIFCASVGLFSWQFSLLINKYLSYPINTVTTVEYSEMDFPAVTVCNINPYKYSMAATQDPLTLTDPTLGLFPNYLNALSNLPTTNSLMGFSTLNDSAMIQAQANSDLVYIAQNNRPPYNAMAFALSELVLSCVYNTNPCELNTGTTGDFKQYADAVYGYCYTFNYKSPAKYQATRAGNIFGLKMLLKSDQSEYFPHIESGGARVAINYPTVPFFASTFGYDAAVGLSTMFGVRQTKVTRKPKPYGLCTETAAGFTYYYPGDYSVEGCFRSCYQQKAIATCGCADPRFKMPSGTSLCQLGNACMAQFSSTQNFSTSFNPTTSCTCPPPCTQITYAVTVSTSKWPSAGYTPLDCINPTASPLYNGISWTNTPTCLEYFTNNTAMIEVFYEQMSFQLLAETPAYTMIQFISDLGGQVGLWFGLSFITIIEFFSFLILLCCYIFHRCKHQNRIKNLAREQIEKEELEKRQKIAEREALRAKKLSNFSPYEASGSGNAAGHLPPGVAGTSGTFRFAPDLHRPDDDYY